MVTDLQPESALCICQVKEIFIPKHPHSALLHRNGYILYTYKSMQTKSKCFKLYVLLLKTWPCLVILPQTQEPYLPVLPKTCPTLLSLLSLSTHLIIWTVEACVFAKVLIYSFKSTVPLNFQALHVETNFPTELCARGCFIIQRYFAIALSLKQKTTHTKYSIIGGCAKILSSAKYYQMHC